MTLAHSAADEVLLERSLRGLAAHGWPVFVTDGGSSERWFARIRRLPGISASRASGLVEQVQTSIHAALEHGARSVLYTEPDKEDFFANDLAAFVQRAARIVPRSVAVAARSTESFLSFPPHQQATEGTINARCGAAFGVRGDYSYGPFAMSRSVALRVSDAPRDGGWGWRHFIFGVAHRLGQTPTILEGDYVCPLDQRDEDPAERAHRDAQLEQNLKGLSLGLGIAIASPTRHAARS